MSETEVKINSCLFGGYDKKSTEAYIEELRTMIAKLQKELSASQDMNEKNVKRINEADQQCTALKERNQELDSVVQQQKNELETNERVIEVQKEKNRVRSDTLRQQEELLKEKDKELEAQRDETASLKDRVQKSEEQMLELERKLEQKVRVLREQEKTIAQLKDRAEKFQYMYEKSRQGQEKFSASKVEQFVQEAMKLINGWKR